LKLSSVIEALLVSARRDCIHGRTDSLRHMLDRIIAEKWTVEFVKSRLRATANLFSRIKLMLSVQSCPQK